MKIAIDNNALPWFDLNQGAELDSFEHSQLSKLMQSGMYDFLITDDRHSGGLLLLQLLTNNPNQGGKKSNKKPKYLQHKIDISGFVKQQGHSFPASKKTLFSQAIGRKTQSVVDATGGWMGDTLLMCSQNYAVTIVERYWLLQGFIAEACHRLGQSSWLIENKAPLPVLVKQDSTKFFNTVFNNDSNAIDCVYIDPMFPPKVKKSAAVRKSMQVLHELVGQDNDAKQLFAAAWQSNVKRIVVKRPDYATSLGADLASDKGINNIQPTEILSGKLVRYDVYIR